MLSMHPTPISKRLGLGHSAQRLYRYLHHRIIVNPSNVLQQANTNYVIAGKLAAALRHHVVSFQMVQRQIHILESHYQSHREPGR